MSRKFPIGSTKGPTADIRMKEKAVKSSACWSWKPSQNLSNKGGCKITGKGTIKTGTKVNASKDIKKDVSSLRYIVLPNWGHEEHLESTSSQPQGTRKTDAPESSRYSNPTATSTNPPDDPLETLTVETPIPTA
nr:hypothetical protein [Tanacetum cinerariifolium]